MSIFDDYTPSTLDGGSIVNGSGSPCGAKPVSIENNFVSETKEVVEEAVAPARAEDIFNNA